MLNLTPEEQEYYEEYYKIHPQVVEIEVISTTNSCTGLFDYGFQAGSTDKGGNQRNKRQARIEVYYGNKDIFLDKRKETIKITSQDGSTKNFVISTFEHNETQGCLSVWLV